MMDLTWKWEAIRQVNTRGKFQGAARPILKRFILSEGLTLLFYK